MHVAIFQIMTCVVQKMHLSCSIDCVQLSFQLHLIQSEDSYQRLGSILWRISDHFTVFSHHLSAKVDPVTFCRFTGLC